MVEAVKVVICTMGGRMSTHTEYVHLEEKIVKLEKTNHDLQKTIAHLKAAYHELQESFLYTMHNIMMTAESAMSGESFSRVARYSALMAKNLGMPEDEIRLIRDASATYDLGKIGIPVDILCKTGPLSDEEFSIVKTHTIIGGNLLGSSEDKIFLLARQIALSHHERWDGAGYPIGLAERKIPLPARIVALADVFDALVSKRPYRAAFSVPVACEMIRDGRNRHFDPEVVDVFDRCFDDLMKIRSERHLVT